MDTKTQQPSVSIIILNWNGRDDTLGCLKSLVQIDYINYTIVLVDNASTDGLTKIVRYQFPHVKIIENAENLGFAEGNNVGIRKALSEQADYILLVNNDTLVKPNFLSKLIWVGEKYPTVGMLSPVIYYENPPDRLWFYKAGVNWNNGFAYHHEQDLTEINTLTQDMYDSEYLTGCALLVKSHVIESIGLLDHRFFAYYEDVDWSLRCQQAGWRTTVVPSSVVWHKLSSNQNSDYGKFLKYRNTILFLWKHSTRILFLRRVKKHIYNALAEYSWDKEEFLQSTRFSPLDGVWAGLTGQYGSQRKKMPIVLEQMIYHLIRYWLWLFRFPT